MGERNGFDDHHSALEAVFSDWNSARVNSYSLTPHGTGVRLDSKRSNLEQKNLLETVFEDLEKDNRNSHDWLFSDLEETGVDLL